MPETSVLREADNTRCPLCGGDNQCGLAADLSSCWCFTTTIRREVLERVPPEAQGVMCVCQACATGMTGNSTSTA